MAICFNSCTCEEAENRNPKSRKKAINKKILQKITLEAVSINLFKGLNKKHSLCISLCYIFMPMYLLTSDR